MAKVKGIWEDEIAKRDNVINALADSLHILHGGMVGLKSMVVKNSVLYRKMAEYEAIASRALALLED